MTPPKIITGSFNKNVLLPDYRLEMLEFDWINTLKRYSTESIQFHVVAVQFCRVFARACLGDHFFWAFAWAYFGNNVTRAPEWQRRLLCVQLDCMKRKGFYSCNMDRKVMSIVWFVCVYYCCSYEFSTKHEENAGTFRMRVYTTTLWVEEVSLRRNWVDHSWEIRTETLHVTFSFVLSFKFSTVWVFSISQTCLLFHCRQFKANFHWHPLQKMTNTLPEVTAKV